MGLDNDTPSILSGSKDDRPKKTPPKKTDLDLSKSASTPLQDTLHKTLQLAPRTQMSTPIPKGKGRRGQGIRSVERRPGQSYAPIVNLKQVDIEILSRSLSEFAFFMDDAVFEEAPDSEGEILGDSSTSLSLHDVTTPVEGRRPTEEWGCNPFLHTQPRVSPRREEDGEMASYSHDAEGWEPPRKGTPFPWGTPIPCTPLPLVRHEATSLCLPC